jgi:hypothetical protein
MVGSAFSSLKAAAPSGLFQLKLRFHAGTAEAVPFQNRNIR